jgi:hypothetical protein
MAAKAFAVFSLVMCLPISLKSLSSEDSTPMHTMVTGARSRSSLRSSRSRRPLLSNTASARSWTAIGREYPRSIAARRNRLKDGLLAAQLSSMRKLPPRPSSWHSSVLQARFVPKDVARPDLVHFAKGTLRSFSARRVRWCVSAPRATCRSEAGHRLRPVSCRGRPNSTWSASATIPGCGGCSRRVCRRRARAALEELRQENSAHRE